MEHRYYPRIAIQNRLLIHVRDTICVSGVIKNISSGGLAMASGDSGRLKKNALVKVALMVHGTLIILPSQVIRKGANEVALMFIEDASPGKQVLRDWLNAAQWEPWRAAGKSGWNRQALPRSL